MQRSPTNTLALVAVLSIVAPGSRALAHGREPALGHVELDPRDHAHVVVRATWGFVTTRDEGETWSWQCADAVPFDGTREDPGLAMFASGAMVAATFDGLYRSDARACSWGAVAGTPVAYFTDVIRDPADPSIGWALASPGTVPDSVYRSDDEGVTWSVTTQPHASALTDRIRVAPSDPTRVYTSGVVPRTDTEARVGMVLRSDDRAMSFRALPIELVGEERTIHVLGIDPMDADRVFARAVRRVTDDVPERLLLSEDGGETWRTVLEMLEIVGFAISPDGATVWAGSWDGGFSRSVDRGRTFAPLDPALRVRCLAARAGELWVCADGFVSGFAIARSTDDGETLEPLWAFHDVVDDVGCPPETPVGRLCPMYWPDLTYDLQLDGAVPPDGALLDGGTSPMDAGGDPPGGGGTCSCRVAGSATRAGAPPALAAIVSVLAALSNAARRTRHRRATRQSKD